MNKKIYLLLLPLILWLSPAQALVKTTTHNETTAPLGDVHFFLRVAYPLTIEHQAFISKVYQVKGLNTYVHMMPLSPSEMKKYRKNPSKYVDEVAPVPDSYKPDPKKLMALAQTIKEFDMVEGDPNISKKYKVIDYPSFLYFAPDGKLYHYPFKAFKSTRFENVFWKNLKEYQKRTPHKKMWKNKQWAE